MNIICVPPGFSSTAPPAGISSPPSTGRMVMTSSTISIVWISTMPALGELDGDQAVGCRALVGDR